MTTTPSPDRPLRADAERNRQRILAAAADLFAERGLDVSLDEIAAAAGVGVGTVYRRFSDKDALIDALFEDKIEQVVQVATDALAIEDPWESLRTFMFGVVRLQARDRGLKEALLSRERGTGRISHPRERIAPLAMQVFQRARDAGVIRPDLDGLDIPLMHMAVGHVAERTRDVDPQYWERLLGIFLDGIVVRRDDSTPLPSGPIDGDGLQAAMHARRC